LDRGRDAAHHASVDEQRNLTAEEMAGVPVQALEEYFRSHPPASERIAAFEKEIAVHQWDSNRPQRPLKIRTIFRTEQAEKLDAEGKFQKAVARYRDAIQDDPNYIPARRGLVRELWRSGDPAATIAAAEEALSFDHSDVENWHILALADAANSCSTAAGQFQQQESKYPPGSSFITAAARIDGDGLSIFCNDQADDGLRNYNDAIVQVPGIEREAQLRTMMAGWMYRATRLEEALKEVETAFQQSPATLASNRVGAWALTDLGRQADALNALMGSVVNDGENQAALAVVHWRTEQRDLAKREFAQATRADPVWMEPHWAANNYSAKTAAVISELRAGEIARRKEEEEKKRRAVVTGEVTPH